MRYQPHTVAPTPASARVALAYKNFQSNKGVSHTGLGISALHNMRTLRSEGIWTDVWPINSAKDLDTRLTQINGSAHTGGQHPISHVIVSAPWIPTTDFQKLLTKWPDVHFAVVSHSNVGFLMADPNGIKLLREGLDLTLGHHNFSVGGNCQRFVDAWTRMYGVQLMWLPNLYDISTIKPVGQRVPWNGSNPLRVGVFGATRPLKNLVSDVAAVVELSKMLRVDVEAWMNSGRNEGGSTVLNAVTQLTQGVRGVKIVEAGWQTWPQFRQTVAKMHVLLNVSYSESFNVVTADGIAEGVASVISDAIDWAPRHWIASADDVNDIARTARNLLDDVYAVDEGQAALRNHTTLGIPAWKQYLGV
jgi:hypothetical protein